MLLSAQGKRVWKEGDLHKGKKNVVHAMRWLEYGIEIAMTGKVESFHKGNEYWEQVCYSHKVSCAQTLQIYGKEDITWEEIEGYIKPLYSALAQKLAHVCTPKHFSTKGRPQKGLWVIDYIYTYGLQALSHVCRSWD